jgi:hypothetical protein
MSVKEDEKMKYENFLKLPEEYKVQYLFEKLESIEYNTETDLFNSLPYKIAGITIKLMLSFIFFNAIIYAIKGDFSVADATNISLIKILSTWLYGALVLLIVYLLDRIYNLYKSLKLNKKYRDVMKK